MTKFDELFQRNEVDALEGEVSCHWKLRQIETHSAFADNGPLKDKHTTVFSLLLVDNAKNKIMVYFYDAWAAGTYNLCNGDRLIITCPSRTIFPSNKESGDTIPFCLAISAAVDGSDHIEIRVRRKPSLEFILTSENITSTSIPAPASEVSLKRHQRNKMEDASKKAKHANFMYTYLSWDDVDRYHNVEANFYGMIYDYNYVKTSPRATHTYSVSFGIVGLTPSPTKIIPLVIFSKDDMKIPRPVAVGDIIRVHRAKMQQYQDAPQAVAWVDKSSFIIFHRKCNIHSGIPTSRWSREYNTANTTLRDWHVSASADGYSWAESDQEILDNTYAASQKYLMNAPSDTKDHTFSSLYDIEHHVNASHPHDITWDTVAMVVNVILPEAGIGQPDQEDPLCMRLLVWDGSNAGDIILDESSPIVNKHTFYHIYAAIRCGVSYARQELHTNPGDVTEAMVDALVADKIVDPATPFVPLNIKFAASNPHVKILGGLSYIKVAHSAKQRLAIRDLRLVPGQWIRLKKLVPDNSIYRLSQDTHFVAAAKFNDASVVNVLPTYHRDVLAVMRAFNRRLLSIPRPPPPRQLMSSFGVRYSTLAVCLASPPPAIFVTLASIVGWYPSKVAKYVEEGEKLLGGVSAEEFANSMEIQRTVEERLNALVQETAVIELKLCSYMTSRGVGQTADEDDHRPLLKRLSVFDTCLVQWPDNN